MTDFSKLKPGDEVLLPAKVVKISDPHYPHPVEIHIGGDPMRREFVAVEEIAYVRPAKNDQQ